MTSHIAANDASSDVARTRRIRSFLNRESILLGFAMAAVNAWVIMCFQSEGLYSGIAQHEMMLDRIYMLSLIANLVTYLAAFGLSRQVKRLFERPHMLLALTLLMALSTICLPFVGRVGSGLGLVLLLLGAIMTGVSSALVNIYWVTVVSLFPTHIIVVACTIACTFGEGLLLVPYLPFENPIPATILTAAMPLLAFVLLRYVVRMKRTEEYQVAFLAIQESDEHTRKNIVLRVCLFSLFSGPLFEFIRTIYVKLGISNTGAFNLFGIYVESTLILAVIAAAVIIWVSREPQSQRTLHLYRVIMIAATIDVLLMPLVFAGDMSTHQAYAINVAATSSLSMLMLIVYSCICRGNQESSVKIVALLKASSDIGPLLGLVLGKWVVVHVAFTFEFIYISTIVLVVIWLITCAFVFTERTLGSVLQVISSKGQGNFMKHCRIVAERYGLSERESEILVYFAKGRNSAYIQEKLFLSKNTVNSHRKHIYTKLGVHSNQELIDLVQGTEENAQPADRERKSSA